MAEDIIAEMQKPGLILLAAGKTYQTEIYPIVDKFFQENPEKINVGAKFSPVDERVTDDPSLRFSNSIAAALPSVADKIYQIDPEQPKAFDDFVKAGGGPRIIYFGLGVDPKRAHVAFIGEESLNATTEIVNLSEIEQPNDQVTKALTIGTDIFDLANLTAIRVVVSGAEKAESLKQGLEDPKTGLGYVVAKYPEKLEIFADAEAASEL